MKPRSSVLLLLLSILVGGGCVYLGLWQLDRLSARRARNARAVALLARPPLELPAGAAAPAVEPYRRVRIEGVFDFTREVVLTARPRNGSPGVYVATPVRPEGAGGGSDSLVLVLRGWVYSPDAATIDFTRWREPGHVRLEGYALAYEADRPTVDSALTAPRAVRRLDHARLERRFGAPLAPFYVVMTGRDAPGDSTPADSTPGRLADPALDEGPHFSYAVQWFLFATIFGAGGVLVWIRGRRGAPRRMA